MSVLCPALRPVVVFIPRPSSGVTLYCVLPLQFGFPLIRQHAPLAFSHSEQYIWEKGICVSSQPFKVETPVWRNECYKN